MEPYSQAIGRFVRGLSIDDVPQAVVDKAKLVLLDTIGVALASSTMQFGAMVTRVAQAFRGGVAEPVMLIRGRAGLEEFTDEAIHEPTVLALARKVRYELDSTIDYP